MGIDKKDLVVPKQIKSIDQFLEVGTPTGSIARAITNNLYGISNNNTVSLVPRSKNSHGFAFFTRPQLNLSSTNLRRDRRLYQFLTTRPASIHRYVRMMLDPRLADSDEKLTCPFIDNKLAFIPLLTNNLHSMSGWNDIVLPTYTSPDGVRREQWSIGDGAVEIYESWDLDTTFRNVKDDPLTLMLQLWVRYIALVFEGMLAPYNDFIAHREIDYQTRIYRLVLDETKTYVKNIAIAAVAFPVNVPMGKFFDFNNKTPYTDQTSEVNIRWKCTGAEYADDILIDEFNKTAAIFNPDIRAMLNQKECNLEKVPYGLLDLFNYRCYPLINQNTFELEWYVDKSTKTYKRVVEYLNIVTEYNKSGVSKV